jgi:hypothetical protein
LAGSGAINNEGVLFFNATASCGNITGTGATTVASHASLTQSGAAFTQGGGLVNDGTVVIDGSGVVGPISGSGAITLGNGTSANTVQLASGSGASSQDALNISIGSTLDITNNHVIINYGANPDPVAAIRSYLVSGYNGGSWNGPGIDSSTAAANPGYALGYADGADGVVVGLSSGQIEIKYTLLGDADLDGSVTGSDFTALAGNLGKSRVGWDKGDFLYTGSVTGSDFTALIQNLGKSAIGADVAIPASDYTAIDAFAAANGLMADVPEPTSKGIVVIGAMCMLVARGRSSVCTPS